jgi:hypothetical protein
MKTDAYVFAYQRPDGAYGAVADAQQRLIVTTQYALACVFVVALTRRLGLAVNAVKRNPVQVAELVMSQHVAAHDIGAHLAFIEDEACTDVEDTFWRAVEMANAVPVDGLGDWHAAHAERVTA